MAHNQRRHCGAIQSVAHKAKYQRQFARTEANKAKHRAKAEASLQAKLSRKRELFNLDKFRGVRRLRESSIYNASS